MHALDIPDLWEELRRLLTQVPTGRVTTYGRLATALGDVAAARWVAQALLRSDAPDDLPAHRVILRDGSPGEWSQGTAARKLARLRSEGIRVRAGHIDLSEWGVTTLVGSRPLERLQTVQLETARRARKRVWRELPTLVAGVDVSYGRRESWGPQRAVAAYVLCEVMTGAVVWSTTLLGEVSFPYIPGYLAFRELPLLIEVIDQARQADRLAPLVLVDGNGWLHPRRAGIATQLGVHARCATLGVGKHLLCGRLEFLADEPGARSSVIHEGEVVATALRPRTGGAPFYVSVGTGVDQETATTLAWNLCREHRVPEPVWQAHTVCTRAARQLPPTDSPL